MEYNEEKEQSLLKICRYFNGMPKPEDNLGQNEQMLWWYERKWLFESMRGCDFKQYIAEYKRTGLESLCSDDGIPIELKALLFERYSQCFHFTEQAATSFAGFYKQYYS